MDLINLIGRRLGAAFCFIVIFSTAILADELPWSLGGRIVVTAVSDGDTIRSGQLRIRLHGIDAPERQQQCTTPEGRRWACGNAALNGGIFAVLTAGLAWLWFGNAEIAAVMAVAMLANLFIAGLSGTLVPLGLLRAGIDPAVASSVFVTTITDIVGFFVFLGLAALYLM